MTKIIYSRLIKIFEEKFKEARREGYVIFKGGVKCSVESEKSREPLFFWATMEWNAGPETVADQKFVHISNFDFEELQREIEELEIEGYEMGPEQIQVVQRNGFIAWAVMTKNKNFAKRK